MIRLHSGPDTAGMKDMRNTPDIAEMRRLRYLTKRDIMRVMHVGYKKAGTIMDLCQEHSKASGWEQLQGRIYWQRILDALGIREEEK